MTLWRTGLVAIGLGCAAACSAGANAPAPTSVADPANGSGALVESAPRSPVAVHVSSAPHVGVRVDLRVLVVSDGSPSVEAIASELAVEQVPFTKIVMTDPGRAVIDEGFLADPSSSPPHGRFQAIVLADQNPFPEGSTEMAAIHAYERAFGIRQVDAFTPSSPDVGLEHPWIAPGWSGPLDGMTATVTAEGLDGPFSYLNGPIPIEDNDPKVNEAFGYLSEPTAAPGDTFISFVTASPPGTDIRDPIVGEFDHDGRQELVITMAHNFGQFQDRLLAHGIVTWMTNGIHLGLYRNAYTAQVDDVFLQDGRWDPARNCTVDESCPSGIDAPVIRMTADDVRALIDWETRNHLRIDLVFNGGGSDTFARHNGGSDPELAAFRGHEDDFGWISHTFNHTYLGCVRDPSTVPAHCQVDSKGRLRFLDRASIVSQFTKNLTWARTHSIPVTNPHEVVTGEHSGLRFLPDQPVDNPGLGPALADAGITLLASDASREPSVRLVGSATALPRWPTDLFHDVGTTAEEVDEYNWRYGSLADGGSGNCDTNLAVTSCISPLDPGSGFQSTIVPVEAELELRHVLTNDAKPHYFHQNNLAEDRLLYPLLDAVAGRYRSAFAPSAPLWQPTFAQSAAQVARQAAWGQRPDGSIEAYIEGDTVHVVNSAASLDIPLTVPEGSAVSAGAGGTMAFGESYAGERSAWVRP